MPRLVAVLCCLLVVLAVPIWLLMVGFSPSLLAGQAVTATTVQKWLGNSIVAAIWIVPPAWILVFGWEMIRSWRTNPLVPAIVMALPPLGMIALMVWINFGSFAP